MKLFRAHYLIDGIVILLAKEPCKKISKTLKGAGYRESLGVCASWWRTRQEESGSSCDLVDVLEENGPTEAGLPPTSGLQTSFLSKPLCLGVSLLQQHTDTVDVLPISPQPTAEVTCRRFLYMLMVS